MKKFFFLGMVALIALALAGCPEPGEEPDGPSTKGTWDRILNDLDVQTGDNPGEIKYKFSSIDDSSTAVYKLYYFQGSMNSADAIVLTNQAKNVSPCDEYTALYGFTPDKTYSVVVEAKKGTSDVARSAVKLVTAKEGTPKPDGLTLTVTGIPKTALVVKANLLDNDGKIVAVTPIPAIGGVFTFAEYDPAANQITGDAFRTTGSYYINLMNATDSLSATPTYTYVSGKYAFTQPDAALTWDAFKPKAQLALVVTGIPADTKILAATLFDSEPAPSSIPKAAGINFNGAFKFNKFISYTQMGDVFTASGQYYIVLATAINGDPPNYIYIGETQALEQFNFTAQETTAFLTWDDFFEQTSP